METLTKIVLVILGIVLIIAISLGINWLFTYGIIWVVNGIFSVDYWEKFRYVFWGLWIIQWILGSPIKRS
ncbi:MAG: hypothetical protein PVG65_00565 [Candidatus Thorarchaeota archaeon]|jgi:hypothetical protein